MAQSSATNNSGCLILFGGVFAGGGFVFLAAALATRQPDHPPTAGIFGPLMFIVIGIATAAVGKTMKGTAAVSGKLMAENPDKPWLWREDWANGYANPEWRSTAAIWGGMGVIFLVIMGPSLMAIPQAWASRHRYETPIVLVFPLAGLYLLSVSARAMRRESKFQKTRLKLSAVPGVLGGRVEGNLETAYVFPPGTQVRLTLSCVRSYDSGGSNHSHWESALWQETQVLPAYTGGPGSSIPIAFRTPFDARETDGRNHADEIYWKLAATAAVPGLNFRADFHVPVFRTAASDASLTMAKLTAQSMEELRGRRPDGAKITQEPSDDGSAQFHVAAGRNNATAAAFGVFGLLFLVGGVFFGMLVGSKFTWFLGVIPLFLGGLTGVGLLAFATWMGLGTSIVGVRNRSLRIHSSCLGFSRTRVIDAATIRDMELYPGMTSADRIWYDLKIRLDGGRTITAASAMDQREAEWFVGELKRDLGLQ